MLTFALPLRNRRRHLTCRQVVCYLSLVFIAFTVGCGGPNAKVVGDSNGWTIEQYEAARVEEAAAEALPSQ